MKSVAIGVAAIFASFLFVPSGGSPEVIGLIKTVYIVGVLGMLGYELFKKR
jgi:hypothetical protein